jgi:hypothetical protein
MIKGNKKKEKKEKEKRKLKYIKQGNDEFEIVLPGAESLDAGKADLLKGGKVNN